jgi:hypothetical protein
MKSKPRGKALAIQYIFPACGELLCRNLPTFSREGTTSLTLAFGSTSEGSLCWSLRGAAFVGSNTRTPLEMGAIFKVELFDLVLPGDFSVSTLN